MERRHDGDVYRAIEGEHPEARTRLPSIREAERWTPLDQRAAGRLGGLATRARLPNDHRTARRARSERSFDRVDPDGVLPEDERIARAEAARRADMVRVSAADVAVRRRGWTPVRVRSSITRLKPDAS